MENSENSDSTTLAHSDQSLLAALNRHGYFFQLRIESEILSNSERHSWMIVGREHYWQGIAPEAYGFIDLILRSDRILMAIEAKRVDEGSWVFIVADHLPNSAVRTNMLWTFRSNWIEGIAGWFDFTAQPESYEAMFCIRLIKDSKGEQLESVASSTLASLESLARENLTKTANIGNNESWNLYVPVIVTTAQLRICEYEAQAVDLLTGKWSNLDEGNLPVVPYLRFRKAFRIVLNAEERKSSIEQLVRESEPTVYVVNVSHLIEFLANFKVPRDRQPPWDRALGRASSI